MNREHGGHEGASPKKSGHPSQQKKKQNARQSMDQNIGEVMPAGAQPVELAIEHVAQPCHRMPVGRVDVREGPFYSGLSDAGRNMLVFVNVDVVVEVDETVVNCLTKRDPNQSRQRDANADGQASFA